MDGEDDPREDDLRRRAERHGLYLRKARGTPDRGSFVLVDQHTLEVIHGPGLDAEQVAVWLHEHPDQPAT